MKSQTLVALTVIGASAVFAQKNSTSNPFIPSTASANCQAYLAELNGNSKLKTCLKPYTAAVSAFVPTSGSSASAKEVDAALESLCHATACDTTLIVGLLNDFGSACEAELDVNDGDAMVKTIYDLFYTYTPWRQALCAVDTGSETSCIKEIVAGIEPSAGSDIANSTLTSNSTTTDDGTGNTSKNFDISTYAGDALDAKNLYVQTTSGGVTVSTPNAQTISDSNLLYMFISPKMPSKMVCTQCTKTALVQFLAFQSSVPYKTGLASSPTLGAQADLWDGLAGACGSGFVNAIQTAAIGSNVPSSVGSLVFESRNYILSVALVGAGFLFM